MQLHARITKPAAGVNTNVALPKTVVFKSLREVPPYLKLVKADAGINKNVAINNHAKTSIVKNKMVANNIFINATSLFATGMNAAYAIPASVFIKDPGKRIILWTNTWGTDVQRAIYPKKYPDNILNPQAKENPFLLSVARKINETSNQIADWSWVTVVNLDGSFFIESKLSPDRSGLGFNPARMNPEGRIGVAGNEVSMMAKTETVKTKFIAYQSNWCGVAPIWLYNPASKTVLGKKIIGQSVQLSPVPIADALGHNVPSGIDISWDISSFTKYGGDNYPTFSYYWYKNVDGNNDNDHDGSKAIDCGGDDCDDNDSGKSPGRSEVCDALGKDEDCNPSTCGNMDADGDGYVSDRCFNVDATGRITSQGNDCDDNNVAIFPGVQ